VNFQKYLWNRAVLSVFFLTAFSCAAAAQVTVQSTPSIVIPTPKPATALVGSNSLYCAGFIQTAPINTENRIIGANDETDKYQFSQNDFMIINMGSNKGVKVGDVFSVVRPRGQFKSHWSDKGPLGAYVQEVGAVEVVKVGNDVSAARIKSSCDVFVLGDLVQLTAERTSPPAPKRPVMDRFLEPSGKTQGRVMMSRDGAELLTRDYIVYVDLGVEDHVANGDHLTIFRELGTGNLGKSWDHEDISARDYGFESDQYHGGTFSNKAGRKSGSYATGREVSTSRAKNGRPMGLRKVVGEAVVLNVKEKTATVVITRTTTEIHTGDWVELQ
jgi:hypothetical protein